MVSWIVWLIVAAVLGVAELLTTTLAFGLIAVAAVVAAVVGVFHAAWPFSWRRSSSRPAPGSAWSARSPSATSSSRRRCGPEPPLWSGVPRSCWKK